ncbi:MAG: cell envelope integrity protein TolA [Deltaproteobacteria bacterium]|uniref:Cell envelope integrity protein TolA n=1 Tax=Candidatus Zymogenus saltonus TaxID=2844893 RepID=A0A9D8KHW6_9DELT|nr:cell envelope integrity protein TolA [Candidatus Zymogenus saltonus]
MARLSRLDGNAGGIYMMIALSAFVHVAVFVILGVSSFDKREMTIYSPPYSVSLVPGEYTGDFGEGGEEGNSAVEESMDSLEPVATGGAGAIKEPSKTKEAKDSGGEKEKVEEVKKETTADLNSAIERIRKKVALDEERKKLESIARERESKEKLKSHDSDLAKAPDAGSPAGGGSKPGGRTPTGTRPPKSGKPGGGSPFGTSNVYTPGGSGMGIPDAEFSAYYKELWKRVRAGWSVPDELLEKDLETVLGIRIEKDGKIIDVWTEKGSGDDYFDETALRAVRMANPLPPLPEKYRENTMDVGIRFHSRKF